MSPELEQLNNKIKQADRIIFYCMLAILILVVFLFGGVIIQSQINSDKARDLANENARISREQALQNHKRTQEYVKCVNETLTVPIAQRKNSALDACTNEADVRTKDAD